jgi:hypothetical protein
MKRRVWLVALVGFLVCGGYVGWDWYCGRDVLLSEPPRREVGTLAVPDRESEIGLQLETPLDVLRSAIESQIPPDFDFDGVGDDVCVRLLVSRVCAGTRYEGRATFGSLTLTAAGGTLRAGIPVVVTGKGGLRGDAAEILDLDGKNFRAAIIGEAEATFDLSPEWCPQIDGSVDFRWTEPARVEIIGGVWVDVSSHVEGPLRSALAQVLDAIRQAISCVDLQEQVRSIWRTYSFPVDVGHENTIYVQIDPSGIGFSGIIMLPDRLRMSLSVRAITSVSTTAGSTALKDGLPPLIRIDDAPGRIALSVPARLGYNEI